MEGYKCLFDQTVAKKKKKNVFMCAAFLSLYGKPS